MTLETAIQLAVLAHKGQVDKQGAQYILHPLRVMIKLKKEEDRIVGVLHDVIEDTNITLKELSALGFTKEIIEAVDCLTRKDESYEDFILQIKKNPIARRVKLADLADNTDPERGSMDAERVKKYTKAINTLTI